MSHDTKRRTIRTADLVIPPGSGWSRLPFIAGGIGLLAVAVSLLLARSDPGQFYHSWLVAFAFFLSLALGGLIFVLIHHATKSGWGVAVRRLAEHAAGTVPLFVLLFLPVLLGMHELYHWSHTDAVAHDEVLKGKEAYLNAGFFTARVVIYFGIWTLLALWFGITSRRQDENGDERLSRRMVFFAGPSIMIFALTITFAAFDWLMSLDPHWYSTMFGVYYFAGCLVGIFAFLLVLSILLRRTGPLDGIVNVEHYHDLGKLLFGFTVFWSYIAFAQFFLIWYANIPEETVWYLHRQEGSWMTVTQLLGWGHFALPFLFLMPRTVKRKEHLILAGSLWMLFIHLVDIHWLVMPSYHHEGVQLSLLDLTTLLGVGGLFIGALAWQLNRRSLVPIGDPRLAESLSFENL